MKCSRVAARIEVFILLLLSVGMFTGCEPEMPMPPPRESANPAEDDFAWAMERMEHAIERFQPTSTGLRVKREFSYKLIPPSDSEPDYTALVTISTKAVFTHDPPSQVEERKEKEKQKAKEAAEKLNLEDPYGLPGQDPAEEGLLPQQPAPAEVKLADIPDPRLPKHEIEEEKEYLLKYVDDQWRLETAEVDDAERIWFDYALQQGEFSPEGAQAL